MTFFSHRHHFTPLSAFQVIVRPSVLCKFSYKKLFTFIRVLYPLVGVTRGGPPPPALHPFGVVKSSTSFGWGKGGKVTSAGWQV